MDLRSLARFKSGDPISHRYFNGIVDALKSEFQVRGPGVRQNGRRVQITSPPQQQQTISLAIASGAISAMSDTAPGQGKAEIQYYDSDSETIKDAGESVDVINPARTSSNGTGDIRSGQMCLAFRDRFGSVILVPIEC